MQYKIPQNVGIEDKIVGPLTLRQLIILSVGVGISYVIFAILSKIYELNILEYIIIGLPALLAAAFALVKINDIPLLKYMFLMLEFSFKPKKRVWDHRGIATLVAPELIEPTGGGEVSAEGSLIELKAKKAANLRQLSQALDSGGFEHVREIEHEDIDDTHDENLVTQAYFGYKIADSPTANMYWRTTDAHKKMLDAFAKMPVTKLTTGTKETEAARKEIEKVKKEVSEMKQAGGQDTPKAPAQKPQQQSGPPTSAPPAPPKADAGNTQNRPRKRNRNLPKPVRKGAVNNTNKNQPAEYIAKNTPKNPAQPKAEKPKDGKKGEFDFRELKKGEIEINLD